MNQITPPPRMDIIPANAPFSEQQRQWLNGFLVGMLGLDGTTPLSPEQTSAMLGPTGDDFHRNRLAMDGVLPVKKLPLGARARGQGFNSVLQTTHRQNYLVPPRIHRSFPLAEL